MREENLPQKGTARQSRNGNYARREKNIHHEATKFTKFKSINVRTLRDLRAFVVSPFFFATFTLLR